MLAFLRRPALGLWFRRTRATTGRRLRTRRRSRLAAALASTGAYEKAEVLLKGILQREPKNAHVLHNLGRIAQQRGRVAEALAYLERAVRLGYDDGTHLALRRLYEESQ